MFELYHTILYQPLLNLLVFFYNIIPGHDIGLAIIALTFLVKLLFFPLTHKSLTAQRKLQAVQPKIKAAQEKYKDDKVAQTQEVMKIYKEHGVNPLGGCLPLLIQLPLLIALFQVFQTGFTTDALKELYSFVVNPGSINPLLFGSIDVSKPNIVLAILAAVLQFFHTYLMSGKDILKGGGNDMGKLMQRQTLFMMPILTAIISFSLPGALPFYWIVNTAFSLAEHYIVGKRMVAKGELHITD